VVSYSGKTIARWRTAAILKIDISPYLSEKSSDFDAILYTAANFELDERHVIKNEKVALDRLRVRQNVFLMLNKLELESKLELVTLVSINIVTLRQARLVPGLVTVFERVNHLGRTEHPGLLSLRYPSVVGGMNTQQKLGK